jgi:hypothetical protein
MELSFPDGHRIQQADSKIIIQQAQKKGEDFTQQGRHGNRQLGRLFLTAVGSNVWIRKSSFKRFKKKGEDAMKKFILLLLLLAMVMSAAPVFALDDEELPLGSRGKGVLMTDHFSGRPAGAAATMAREGKEKAEASDFPPYPYGDTFLLHSYPSSNYKLYIDFDGHRGYKAWDPAGDGTAFSESELLLIQKIWFLTSEDYMPFTIDVTTEEPGAGFLGMRAVVDGSGRYDYGWAYKGVWPDSDNFAYTGIWNNDWIYIAQAASHEVGHTLNLYDHGQTDGTGYYMGHGEGWTAWGVIMGWDSDSVGVWDDGDYPIPNHPEDSLGILVNEVGSANPGVAYRPDDHGSTTGTATAVDITADLIAEGNIEQVTDVDYFSFTMASAGDVVIAINGDVVMACTNLDILAKIHDASGAVLYTSNPLDRLWATFNVTLGAGDYYISVDGTGYDDPRGLPSEGFGYSDYGILGYYSITQYTGDTNPPTPDPMTFASPPTATGTSSIEMTATTASDPDGVEYNFICVGGPGNDSGWQSSTYYEDFPITPNTEYTYRVYARDGSVAQNQTAASADMSATTDDGPPVSNLVLPANGGVLESFTSEYGGGFVAANLTNGVTNEHGWASATNPTSPQDFVYSFDSGQDATLDRAVMHGGTAEGSYYSKDVEVWTSANGTDFTLAGSSMLLNVPLDSTQIDLGGVTAKKVRLRITSGYSGSWWEMAEFVVWGGIGGGSNVIVPDVVGMAQATAEAAIVAADLTVGTVTTDYSPTVPAGDVISQDPTGGASVAPGTSVDLVVSLGILMVDVPDVVGMAQAAAESAIVAADLVVGTVSTSSSETVPAGDVISQDPTGGSSVPAGSSVDLVVSTGPAGSTPAAPSDLSATAVATTQIDLSWTDNASDETGFKIERSKRVNTAFAQIDTVGADETSYNDTTVSKGTLYYYRVRATNASGDSAYSNEASATTPKKD